jgi:hypothetical protein
MARPIRDIVTLHSLECLVHLPGEPAPHNGGA